MSVGEPGGTVEVPRGIFNRIIYHPGSKAPRNAKRLIHHEKGLDSNEANSRFEMMLINPTCPFSATLVRLCLCDEIRDKDIYIMSRLENTVTNPTQSLPRQSPPRPGNKSMAFLCCPGSEMG